MLRKVLPILFLMVFLIQAIGFTFYFNFERAKIKKQLKTFIKKGVPKDQLKVFEFSNKEFLELKFVKKKEFKLNGRFYDIVWKTKLKNGKLLLKCVDDKQETELFKNLAFLIDDYINKNTNSPLKAVFSLIVQPVIYTNHELVIHFVPIAESKEKYFQLDPKILSRIQTIELPPPDFRV